VTSNLCQGSWVRSLRHAKRPCVLSARVNAGASSDLRDVRTRVRSGVVSPCRHGELLLRILDIDRRPSGNVLIVTSRCPHLAASARRG